MIIVEACVNSATSAIEAEKGGANRVELCDNLYEGGTTPSAAAIILTAQNIAIDLHVLIRPRGGDFLYSDLEFEVMKYDIAFCKENGVKGVVLGILNENGSVDVERTRELVNAAVPMKVTFHRAFDMVNDPFHAIEDIISAGCHRILTSGLSNKAWDGRDMIASLVKTANGRIIIMAGSGVNSENAEMLVIYTGVNEIHTSARSSYPSKMKFHQKNIYMGGFPEIPEFLISQTDSRKINLVVQSISRL
jgi:copper homeostasis protein